MAHRYEISLGADGRLLLHLPMHIVALPLGETGVALLRHILQSASDGQRGIGEAGNPTQHDINAWLRGPEGQAALQLAGDRKRRADIQARTGVIIRQAKPEKRRAQGKSTQAELEAWFASAPEFE